MSEAHYLNKLYPLQDRILQLFAAEGIKHYLTGGTALSRAFLHHRYSEDLDFFLNYDPDFEKESDRAIDLLHHHFENRWKILTRKIINPHCNFPTISPSKSSCYFSPLPRFQKRLDPLLKSNTITNTYMNKYKSIATTTTRV